MQVCYSVLACLSLVGGNPKLQCSVFGLLSSGFSLIPTHTETATFRCTLFVVPQYYYHSVLGIQKKLPTLTTFFIGDDGIFQTVFYFFRGLVV